MTEGLAVLSPSGLLRQAIYMKDASVYLGSVMIYRRLRQRQAYADIPVEL